MEKLLILGNNNKTDSLIKVAKARGIYTILTDNLPAEKSTFKYLADEAWDISVTDVDVLFEKATKSGVTGITCGASEACMSVVRELCKKMNLPFYVSDRAWEITNDKIKFKEACKKHGVPVAKEFSLDISFSKSDLEKITYPVIVKPADGYYSIGLHLCSNEQELIEGYKDAYEKSLSQKVVVEKFYSGAEISLLFTFVNGNATLVESVETYGYKKECIPFIFGNGQSIYEARLKKELMPNLIELFKDLECNSGVGLVQVIMEGKEYAVTEMNYRLPGVNSPCGDYICECVMDVVMSQHVFDSLPPYNQPLPPSYWIWVSPGTIGTIEGIEKIRELPDVATVFMNHKEGDVIQPNSGMRQILANVIMSCDYEQLKEDAKSINKLLTVKDDNGQNMLMRFEIDASNNVIKL